LVTTCAKTPTTTTAAPRPKPHDRRRTLNPLPLTAPVVGIATTTKIVAPPARQQHLLGAYWQGVQVGLDLPEL
jgi:hypothetical protein